MLVVVFYLPKYLVISTYFIFQEVTIPNFGITITIHLYKVGARMENKSEVKSCCECDLATD